MLPRVKQLIKKHESLYLIAKRIKKIFGLETPPFPTKSYIFTTGDAQKVYDVVMTSTLHHSMGHQVKDLEKEFANYHNSKYALATNAGTSALELAVKAVGVKPGDEVIVPAYTFVATAQAVLSRGGIPVFADLDDTFTISPTSIESKITKKTRAIIPVHIFGNVSDMDRINTIAKKNKLFVIEDCCQAIGASYKGKKVGTLGDIGCFSFNENKAITTGQGGMVTTSNKKFIEIMHSTREAGQIDDVMGSDVQTTGNTFALTEMQGALARSILNKLDDLNFVRTDNYNYFVNTIDTSNLAIRWFRILPGALPSFSRLVFMIDFKKLGTTRKSFLKNMVSEGIPMKLFYPIPIYKYSLFQKKTDVLTKNDFPFNLNKSISYKDEKLPFVEKFCSEMVGINFSPYIKHEHINMLNNALRKFASKNGN